MLLRSCFAKAFSLALVAFVLLSVGSEALAQSTVFTYQGRLNDGGAAANGVYDMQFKLYDAADPSASAQIGSTITNSNVAVTNGIFTVRLDFGASALPGANRFLELGVRRSSSAPYTVLAPRQQVTSAPYAIRSANAIVADQLSNTCVGCVQDAQINAVAGSKVTGPLPASSIPAGNSNYIQNTTSLQGSTANFNISGNGTAGTLNAATQYNIGGNRVLSIPGTNNIFAGALTGQANTSGANNAFFGNGAGVSNTTARNNSFFGASAGASNTTATDNAFFGTNAGSSNTAGNNSFFGSAAGFNNSTGGNNAFFGTNTGSSNLTASNNAFFGANAGFANRRGHDNAFFGFNAGSANTGDPNNPSFGNFNAFFGSQAGVSNTSGANNAFFGNGAGFNNTTGINNTFIGTNAGSTATRSNNTFIGYSTGGVAGGVTNATAIGAGAQAASYEIVLGTSNNTVIVPGRINVTGPADLRNDLFVVGKLTVVGRGGAGQFEVCFDNTGTLTLCSSSLRYKTQIVPFSAGLELIRRLHPITFTWKQGGMRDLGLAAEDVAAVEPLLVTHNDQGQIEGVKYDHLNVVLINAIKEQQAQIKEQQTRVAKQQSQIQQQQRQIESLKNLICLDHPNAIVCK